MTPDKDKGDELLGNLGFYDLGEDIEEGDWTKRAKYLRERIKFKEGPPLYLLFNLSKHSSKGL